MPRYLAYLVALLLPALAGCGPTLKLPPMAPVTGVVTLDGAPVTTGMVQFAPDHAKGTEGPASTGAIGPDGRYTLSVPDGGNGAMIGWHRVSVVARASPKNDADTLPMLLVPERYINPATSGLSFEVVAGQTNTIDLQLTSSP